MTFSAEQRLQRSLRTTFLGMAVNVLLAIIKVLTGAIGHSHALIADGVESLADVFSSVIVWRSLVIAAEPPDAEHPYGHGKAEPIAAALVGTMLIVAAVWIAVHSVHEILRPHQTPAAYTLVVLVVVILIKESLFRSVLRAADEVESSAVKGDAWHHRSDAITSVAAAVGIVVALVGGKGWEWADDAAAALASLIIAWNGYHIVRPAFDELMDASAPREMLEQIKTIVNQIPRVDGVEKCFARRHGYFYFVDLHLQVDPAMTVADSHSLAHSVKDALRKEFPHIRDVLVHVEPSRSNATKA